MGHERIFSLRIIGLLGVLLLLLGVYAGLRESGQEKRAFRAAWLGGEKRLPALSLDDMEAFLDQQKENRMNALVMRVPLGESNGVEAVVEACHRRNLEFHAWVQPVADQPEGQQKMVGRIAALVRVLDLDAVLLAADSSFFIEGHSDQVGQAGMEWFLDELADSLRRIKPWVKLGMGPARDWRDRTGGALLDEWNFSPQERQMREWLSEGMLDYLAPRPGAGQSMGSRVAHKPFSQPALVPCSPWKDRVAPFAPESLWAAPGYGEVALAWPCPRPAPDGDTATYYVVYRFSGGETPDTRDPAHILTLTRERHFLDREVEAGKSYHYLVTAVDRLHNESREGSWVRVQLPFEEIVMKSP